MIDASAAAPAVHRAPRFPGRTVAAMSAVLLVAVAGSAAAPRANAAECDPNPIVCENALPGTDPEVWDIEGAGDPAIQGFATDISVDAGDRIDFKIDTDAAAYTIDVYRTGWYQGLGARLITTLSPDAALPQRQPECVSDVSTELYDCGNWAVSAHWNVPSSAVSGVYVAKLTRSDTGGASHITFVVRDDAGTSDVLFQTSDPTWQAYNTYGGSDFYQGAEHGRAYKISYNRPFATRGANAGRDFYFSSEYATVRFLERNGYDVSYFAGVDTDRRGELLRRHEVVLSVGHDEYWSTAQRSSFAAARDAGVDLQFLGGNDGYWHTRYEPSVAGAPTDHRTLVSYKETWSNAKIDPAQEWTGTWRDPRFAATAAGANSPENALIGTMYMSNFSDLPVTVSDREGKNRFWRGTGLADLPAGTTRALADHTVGYESNEDVDNGHRPPGLIRLSTTVGAVPEYLQDFGNTVQPGTTEHHLTLYRAESGALVFSAGTIQWGWALDETHDGDGAPADDDLQQAQVNLFADMGVQPATLQPGLIAAARGNDSTAPTTTIDSPASGASAANGSVVTLSGTAADADGVVAGVEVSTDDGASWHPASGTASWSYEFVVHGMGTVTALARAIDDSGNYAPAATAASVAISVAGPYVAFGDAVPATADSGDPEAVELGLRFVPQTSGYVAGVRFYKSAANTGPHTGTLWGPDGARLASGAFADETAVGWQTLRFDTPVAVQAGTTYTASYTAPAGHYAMAAYAYSAAGLERDPLTLPGGFGSPKAGVYGNPGSFPSATWADSDYGVDVVFRTDDLSPLGALARWPLPDSASVDAATAISATFTKATAQRAVTVRDALGTVVEGTTAYDEPSRTLTFTPSRPLEGFVTYTVELSATTAGGLSLANGATWSFRTARPEPTEGLCPCGLFSESVVPGILEDADRVAVTLGTAFAPESDGVVTGLSFYKSAGNVGPHTGALWRSDGTLLAEGAFVDEPSSGWTSLRFDTPVAVTAGTGYVVSYVAPQGRYSATIGAFAAPRAFGPLRTEAGAGAYSYDGGFPSHRSTTSYLVDVAFQAAAPALAVTATTPAADAIGVDPTAPVSIGFSAPIADGATLTLRASGGDVAGTTSLSADRKALVFTPTAALPAGASIQAVFGGAVALDGAGDVPARSWTFSVAGPGGGPLPDGAVTLFEAQTPVGVADDDGASVEVGTAFSVDVDGDVLGVRFHKGAGNTGTHTGALWDTTTGQRLASVVFSSESPDGWQQARFADPVPVLAGREYVVSYLAPNGHYSYSPAFFANAWTSGPFTAPATVNGRFRYGDGTAIPAFSWNATNYFVDAIFVPADDPSATPDVVGAFFDGKVPTNTSWDDGATVQLGVRFTATAPTAVAGIRFFKAAGDADAHRVLLWGADHDTPLAAADSAGESLSGWQTVRFAEPIVVQPGTEYRATFVTARGRYAADVGALADPVPGGPLITEPNGGVYVYDADAYPLSTAPHNYWVDPLLVE